MALLAMKREREEEQEKLRELERQLLEDKVAFGKPKQALLLYMI